MKQETPRRPSVARGRRLGTTLGAALSAALCGGPAAAGDIVAEPKFSVDSASPAILDHGVTPDDILIAGPAIHTEGRDLGLIDAFLTGFYDDLDALSFGRDPINPTPERNQVYFSVDRVAVGVKDVGDVYREARPGVEEASGDVFRALPPMGSNVQFVDEEQLGLEPGFFGDDLDALELDTEPDPFVYFSIDYLSATNGQGTLDLAADILVSDRAGSWSVYAPYWSMGLDEDDDLDALALWDAWVLDTIADANIDFALFSLDSFSPTVIAGAANPGDILYTEFDGSFSIWATATEIGLTVDDELNALDTIPLPVPLALLLPGLALLGLWRHHTRH